MESILSAIPSIVSGPAVAAVLGAGPLRAVKKIEPEEYPPIMIVRLSAGGSESVRKAFEDACEEEGVYLVASQNWVNVAVMDGRLVVQHRGSEDLAEEVARGYAQVCESRGVAIEYEIIVVGVVRSGAESMDVAVQALHLPQT